MQKQHSIFIPIAILMALFITTFLSIQSAAQAITQVTNEQVTNEKSKEEILDALEAVKDYSITKREDFLQTTKSAVQTLDQRITQLESKLETQADKIDHDMQEKWKLTLTKLRRLRIAVAEKIGELQQSSESAWEEVKSGFRSAYDEVSDAVDEAEKSF